jgi:hypothetical protein
MNDGPQKIHTGYLVEGLELYIHKVAYTNYDAPIFGSLVQLYRFQARFLLGLFFNTVYGDMFLRNVT